MELNDILNGFAGADANNCKPVNNCGCGGVGGFGGGLFGGNWIWLLLLFWLCCGGCGFGGFGGFGGGYGGCCCDKHNHKSDCCGYGGYGFGNSGCTWIIWIIILCVLCGGFGKRDDCHKSIC